MANDGQRAVQIEYLDAETIEQMQSDEEKAFKDFRNSFSGDEMGILRVSRLKVGRFTKSLQNLKGAHCFSVPIDQYEYDELLEVLRERYGGGLYRLVGIQKGHQGTKFNKLVEIAQPERLAENDEGTTHTREPSQNMGEIIERMDNMMESAQERTERMFERFSPVVAQANPLGALKDTIEMLATMGVIGNQNQNDGMGELRKFLEMKTLVKELGGGDDDGGEANFYSLMGKTIETFGAPLAQILQMGVASGAIKVNPAPRVAISPTKPTTEEMEPGKPTAEQMQHLKALKNQITILLMQAKAGVPAVDFAGVVLNQTPDDQLDAFADWIGNENLIEELGKLNPEVLEYRGWFQKLREELIRLLDELIEPEPGEGLQTPTDGVSIPSEGVTAEPGNGAAPDATSEPPAETTDENASDVNGDSERGTGDTPNT